MSMVVVTRRAGWAGRFGDYLAEICRGEGLTDYEVLDLDQVEPGGLPEVLRRFDVVVVARCTVHRHDATALVDRAREGAGLVAVRPSRVLARQLGLIPLDRQTAGGRLDWTVTDPITAGLPAPIQVHVPVDRFAATGSDASGGSGTDLQVLAAVTPTPDDRSLDGSTKPVEPAVFRARIGAGTVVVIGYDLAEAVARLRQGDPARIGTRAVGVLPYRQMDLVLDSVDPACWHLPQADVHAQLLVNAVTCAAPTPVPRWWYYADPEMTSLVIQDSDDDWSTREQFDQIVTAVEAAGFRDTFYLMLGERETVLDADDVARLRERGHSFGIHHDGLGAAWDEGEDQELTLEATVRADIATFRQRFGQTPLVNRNHCGVWSGWADLPRLWAELGIAMDLNAIGTGESWTGYLFGSARPLRFVDLDGTVLDVFQQSTQVYDDLTLIDRLEGDPAGEARLVVDHLRRCQTETFQPVSMQSHPVSYAGYSAEFFRTVWAHARELGLQIWSAQEWAIDTTARDRSSVTSTEDGLTVTAYGDRGARTLMIPTGNGAGVVIVDGVEAPTTRRVVHGIDYLLVRLEASPEGVAHTVMVGG